jgi:hypothetical protein
VIYDKDGNIIHYHKGTFPQLKFKGKGKNNEDYIDSNAFSNLSAKIYHFKGKAVDKK